MEEYEHQPEVKSEFRHHLPPALVQVVVGSVDEAVCASALRAIISPAIVSRTPDLSFQLSVSIFEMSE